MVILGNIYIVVYIIHKLKKNEIWFLIIMVLGFFIWIILIISYFFLNIIFTNNSIKTKQWNKYVSFVLKILKICIRYESNYIIKIIINYEKSLHFYYTGNK